ncbi:hypothetical protein ACGFW5_28480 [Streptomyces sp. NPDC048416]|uniref:hypothetical protein n=1 Tax=Streptomyces sp. NPDC048416 TaxID=3365546 RepID=UPI003720EC7A
MNSKSATLGNSHRPGTDRIEVLRFTDGDIVRYATLGHPPRPLAPETGAAPAHRIVHLDPRRVPGGRDRMQSA